ncbi:prepilin-type cleavage/methylation domain-containing protein [filamentous cyanobacterium CCP5]|nr:prepilin-type cleavage/methylation domain-containing protein [filamentous cyanobacterium CCP5]
MTPFRSNHRSATAGFTLLEVLVVVVLVAILMAIAAPGWLAYLNRQRVRTVQTDLAEVLRQAQTEAQQTRSTQVVTLETGEPVPTVTYKGSQVLGDGNIPENTITLSGSNTAISFEYLGTPPANSVPFVASVTVTGTSTNRCVIVASLLGSIKTASDADCDTLNNTTLSTNTD